MSPDPVRDLIEELRRRGWDVGTGDVVRLSAITRRSTGWTRDVLRLALRAALAKTPEQAAELDEAFALVVPSREEAQHEAPRDSRGRDAHSEKRPLALYVGFLAVVLAASIGAGYAISSLVPVPNVPSPRSRRVGDAPRAAAPEPTGAPLEEEPPNDGADAESPAPTAPVARRQDEEPAPRSSALGSGIAIGGGLGVGLSIYALGAWLWVRRRRRRFVPGPYRHRLRIGSEAMPALFSAHAIDDLAAELGSAPMNDGARIDVARSAEATAKAGGLPTLVVERSRRQAHHAVLLERSPRSRPWRAIYEGLVHRLHREGVGIELFDFGDDPSLPAAGERAVELAEIARTHDGVFVIGCADRFAESAGASGALDALEEAGAVWLEPSLALLGPGARVGDHVELRSASVPGWTDASRQHGAAVAAPPVVMRAPGSDMAMRALRERLGGAYPALRALALLDEPDAGAARVLAGALGCGDSEEMLALLSLPWIAREVWPSELRQRLLEELARLPDERARAAAVVTDLLVSSEPPTGSLAHLEWLARRHELAPVAGAARELDHSPLHGRAPRRISTRRVALVAGCLLMLPAIWLVAASAFDEEPVAARAHRDPRPRGDTLPPAPDDTAPEVEGGALVGLAPSDASVPSDAGTEATALEGAIGGSEIAPTPARRNYAALYQRTSWALRSCVLAAEESGLDSSAAHSVRAGRVRAGRPHEVGLPAQLVFELEIQPDGTVSEVEQRGSGFAGRGYSPVTLARLRVCLMDALRSQSFGPSREGVVSLLYGVSPAAVASMERPAGVRETRAPQIRTGHSDVRGSLSREVITRHIGYQRNTLRPCFESYLRRNGDPRAVVTLSWMIGPDGSILTASVARTTADDATLEGCLVQAVRGWTFPTADGGGQVGVNYPFEAQDYASNLPGPGMSRPPVTVPKR